MDPDTPKPFTVRVTRDGEFTVLYIRREFKDRDGNQGGIEVYLTESQAQWLARELTEVTCL